MPAPSRDSSNLLHDFLRQHTIATLSQLQEALGHASRRTVFRRLKALAYMVSYSHTGRYYALKSSACFDASGLWTCGPARFSRYGSLLATAEALVRAAPTGCVAAELDAHLGVRTGGTLGTLAAAGRLSRAKVGGRFLYCAPETDRKTAQVTARRLMLAPPRQALPAPTLRDLPTPLSASVALFVSLLDEQQRRLFSGLESLRCGPGGDSQTSAALGLDRGTVARGRRELLARDVQRGRTRRPGGARKVLTQETLP